MKNNRRVTLKLLKQADGFADSHECTARLLYDFNQCISPNYFIYLPYKLKWCVIKYYLFRPIISRSLFETIISIDEVIIISLKVKSNKRNVVFKFISSKQTHIQ